jgi:hypothetical protein
MALPMPRLLPVMSAAGLFGDDIGFPVEKLYRVFH